tara:strand:- start:87 stop:1067 length:981 start_codon:yes stop_codon:yes gene_type:complete
MSVVFSTYPWAYFTPGGGEFQIEKLFNAINKKDFIIERYNQWNPQKDVKIHHFFSCIGGSYHFCNYLKEEGKKLVISPSLWITKDTANQYAIEEIRSQLLLADLLVVNSEIEKITLSEVLSISIDKFKVVNNGFDSELADFKNDEFPLIKELPASWRNNYFYCLGNIEQRKNQNILIEAAKLLGFNLVLAGHIRQKNYYEKLRIKDYSNIKYLGPIEHNSYKYRSLFKNAKAFILPSTLETPGLAALEAAAFGLPIIVTKEGSAKEYFGDIKTYFDGKKADISELCELINLINKSPEKGIVKEDIISQYNWNKIAEDQINIYKKLI